jgi:carboxyl-terminal processing protease
MPPLLASWRWGGGRAGLLAAGGLALALAAPGQVPGAPAADPSGEGAPPADQAPRLIAGYRPTYPPEFAASRVEGEIVVDFIVQPDGTVANAHVIRSADPRLSPYAAAAVAKWVFAPGIRHGHAAYTHMQVPVVFQASAAPGPSAADAAAAVVAGHLAAGRAALERKDYAAAAPEFDTAIGLAPDAAPGYLARAQALAAQGRPDEALGDYAQAALLDPANQPALDTYRGTLPTNAQRTWESERYQTFIMVWRTVYETYFDATFGGVDWLAVREKYRVRLAAARDKAALLSLLQDMLGELRRTHFAIIPREAAVFNPSERVRIGTAGTEVAFADGKVVVTEVKPGSTGAAAGLHPGDIVDKVDGVSLDATLAMLRKSGLNASRSSLYVTEYVESRLSAAVGCQVKLEVSAPAAAAKPRPLAVTCAPNDAQWSEPIGYFPSVPIHCDAHRDPDGVALLQFNIFVPPVMRKVRALYRQLRPGDALIIDLRGNGGGISTMASGMSGWLCRNEFVLGSMHQREGDAELDVYPQRGVFDGPVAILIDGRSASTSEILAAGLRDRHRARLFGEPSAGAALPSVFKSLPTGDLFQFAVADVKSPSGALLEGNGVVPDVEIVRTAADLAAGRDPVLQAARAWVVAERRKAAGS